MNEKLLKVFLIAMGFPFFMLAQLSAEFEKIELGIANFEIEKSEQAIQKWAKVIPNTHEDYGSLLFLQAQIAYLKGDFNQAKNSSLKAIDSVRPSKKGSVLTFLGKVTIDLDQFNLFDSLAQIALKEEPIERLAPIDQATWFDLLALKHIEQEKYEKADSFCVAAQKIITQNKLEKTLVAVRVWYHLAESKLESGDVETAQNLLTKAAQQLAYFAPKNHPEYAYIWTHSGRILEETGKYEAAENLFNQALACRAKVFGIHHPTYAQALRNLGLLNYQLGNYAKAETQLLQAKKVYIDKVGKTNFYGLTLMSLGLVYQAMGKNNQSIGVFQEAKNVFANLSNILEYSNCLNNLAAIYQRNNERVKSINLLEEGKKLLEDKGFQSTANYLPLLINLGYLYGQEARTEDAKSILRVAQQLILELFDETHPYYAPILSNLAEAHKKDQEYLAAKKLYLETERIDKMVLGEKHPYFMTTLINAANIHELLEETNQALAYYKRFIKGQTNLIYNYYSTFEEDTRLSYLNKRIKDYNKYFSFVVRQDTIARTAYTEMQNISLATKSLALDFSVDNKVQIDSIQEGESSRLLNEWTNLRKQLSQAYTMSEEERKSASFDLAAMEEQTILLEKKLVRSNEAMAKQFNRQNIVDFNALKSALSQETVAIDFLKFSYYTTTGKTDSVFYGALLTRSEDQSPKFIYLAEEKQLARILKAKIRANGGNYIANPKIGYDLYQLLWKPLQPYLTDIKAIKISPTGLLYKVSFAALPTELSGGETLMNQFRFDYYSNLKDLVKEIKQAAPSKKQITLIGGANFDLDSLALLDLAKDLTTSSTLSKNKLAYAASVAKRNSTELDSTRGTIRFNYLQGTEQEVENIAKQLTAQNWQVQKLTGSSALEDRVKLLSGETAPSILHIATHGYFFGPLKNRKPKSETLKDRIQAATNPLVRSGLVFTGVNHTWEGGGRIPNLDDGVLTAYEISNLHLFNTNLVVLSACETGLGDIYDTEGVFGLQRAFKMAGVQQLITSLWKVPDRQTSKLMDLFYQQYLSSNDAASALYQAQSILSQKYPPYYWAAFILMQ